MTLPLCKVTETALNFQENDDFNFSDIWVVSRHHYAVMNNKGEENKWTQCNNVKLHLVLTSSVQWQFNKKQIDWYNTPKWASFIISLDACGHLLYMTYCATHMHRLTYWSHYTNHVGPISFASGTFQALILVYCSRSCIPILLPFNPFVGFQYLYQEKSLTYPLMHVLKYMKCVWEKQRLEGGEVSQHLSGQLSDQHSQFCLRVFVCLFLMGRTLEFACYRQMDALRKWDFRITWPYKQLFQCELR